MLSQREIDIIFDDNSFSALDKDSQLNIFNLVIQDWAESRFNTAIKNGIPKPSAAGYLNTPTLIYGNQDYVNNKYIEMCNEKGIIPSPYTNWAGNFKHDFPNHIFLISTESESMRLLTWYLYHELVHYHLHQCLVLKNIPKPIICSNVNMQDIICERQFTQILYSISYNKWTAEENIAKDTSFSDIVNLLKKSSLSEEEKHKKLLHYTALYKKSSNAKNPEFVAKKRELTEKYLAGLGNSLSAIGKNINSIIYPSSKQLKTLEKIKKVKEKKVEKLVDTLLQ